MRSHSSLSIFQNAKESSFFHTPSPHLVIKNCLNQELYNELKNNFPTDSVFANYFQGSKTNTFARENVRLSLQANTVLNHKNQLHQVWIDFIKYHTSKEFLDEIINLFGPYISQYYPSLEKNIGDLNQIYPGIRFAQKTFPKPLEMDCQLAVNTPLRSKSSVIEAHTDGIKELYAGLLYMRHENDMAKGGELIVHQWKNNKKRYTYDYMVDQTLVEEVNRVKYEENTLVFFINTMDFVHSVSPREPSKLSRRFVNFLGEIPLQHNPQGLYKRTYKWRQLNPYKIKMLARSILIRLKIFEFIKNIIRN